jgi:hypothetical protein
MKSAASVNEKQSGKSSNSSLSVLQFHSGVSSMSSIPRRQREVEQERSPIIERKPLLDVAILQPFFLKKNEIKPPDLNTLIDAFKKTKIRNKFLFKQKQYKFLRVLGTGTYAVVKECIHLPTDQHVAVKIISNEVVKDQKSHLQLEIDILSRVKHPNLLHLLEYFLVLI